MRGPCVASSQNEMLGGVRDETGGQWAVLVMDSMTTKVMSSVAGISDIMDYSISRESSQC